MGVSGALQEVQEASEVHGGISRKFRGFSVDFKTPGLWYITGDLRGLQGVDEGIAGRFRTSLRGVTTGVF